MHETQRSSSPTLSSPRLYAAETASPCRSQPDPRGHARALIESHGLRSALEIARSNALLTGWREDYWSRVVMAMEERTRARRTTRVPGHL